MPLPRQQLSPMMRMLTPNEQNMEIGDYTDSVKAYSPEMQREEAILANADNRAEMGIRGDLAEADQVRKARDLGFEGSYPLKQQKDEEERSALAKVLLPEQMRLRAAQENNAATRAFTADQNNQNRENRSAIAAGSQTGMNSRMVDKSADIAARSVKVGSNPLRSWLSPLRWSGLVDSNDEVQAQEQARVRGQVHSQMQGTPSTSGGMVAMIAPDGGQLSVPADRVAEMEAAGAQRAQ